jgi:nicotinamide-nucleotide amidase
MITSGELEATMITDPDDRIPTEEEVQDLCEELAKLAGERGLTIATAESLTAGNLASQLGRATSSGDWYCGGVIAYRKEVKYSLLQVPEGPVVSREAARAMARSTAELMDANLAVAVTGEAGPEPQEDKEPGTVWFGIYDHGKVDTLSRIFDGDPPDVLAATVAASVQLLVERAHAADES